jgi:hypothetical protein
MSLTHKIYFYNQQSYLHSNSTGSSSIVPVARPSNPSRLTLTNTLFYHTAPALWNSLPTELSA